MISLILHCEHCGLKSSLESGAFQLDSNQGFWCEDCDGYSYLNEYTPRHKFTLILEDKTLNQQSINPPTNIKLLKQLSPYRYPGGKSKIIDYLYIHLQKTKSKKLVSPFTGGGSFELALLDAGVIEELHINDLDFGVYALWWVIKHMPYVIIDRLETRTPNHKDFFRAQALIKSDYRGADLIEAAWTSLLVNRLAYSGIPKANPLGGKNGSQKQLLSRWKPKNLIERIKKIYALSDRIKITNMNAVELIEEEYWQGNTTIFIDPPYVHKGKDLYHCFYSHDDHLELAYLLDSLHFGFSGADIILTYDYSEWISQVYKLPKMTTIGRTYSL